MSLRDQIVGQIKLIAKANGGAAPGVRAFETKTGIRESDWRGIYWARWSDAVREAGLEPNDYQAKLDTDLVMAKLAAALRHYGRMPTFAEMRLYGQSDPTFPSDRTIAKHFRGMKDMKARLAGWMAGRPDCSDILDLSPIVVDENPGETTAGTAADGYVYLLKSGDYHKIGRGEELERRVKQIRTALPDAATLIHAIRTDDPAGIEAYWHRRFADRRANGEWFKLSRADVAAFERRKFQ